MKEHVNIRYFIFKHLVFSFFVCFTLTIKYFKIKYANLLFIFFVFLLGWMWYLNYPEYLKIWNIACECTWKIIFFITIDFFENVAHLLWFKWHFNDWAMIKYIHYILYALYTLYALYAVYIIFPVGNLNHLLLVLFLIIFPHSFSLTFEAVCKHCNSFK